MKADKPVILRDIADGTDPSPLFLVFSAEDYPDPKRQDLCRMALQNQVHAVLLCELHRCPVGAEYVRSADELLYKTTDGVFQYIGHKRQKDMRRLVRGILFRRIFDFWLSKAPGLVRLEESTLRIQFRDAAQRDEFLDWLEDFKRTLFATSTPPPEQLLLGAMGAPTSGASS